MLVCDTGVLYRPTRRTRLPWQAFPEIPYNPTEMHFHIGSHRIVFQWEPEELSPTYGQSIAKCEKLRASFGVARYSNYASCSSILAF